MIFLSILQFGPLEYKFLAMPLCMKQDNLVAKNKPQYKLTNARRKPTTNQPDSNTITQIRIRIAPNP